MGCIVVGVDGSESSRAALRWAVDEAVLRDDHVAAVIAWHEPYVGGALEAPVAIDPEATERSARAQLDKAVDTTDTSALSRPVERIVAPGGAARTLMDTATGAELLVVGTRGHGGFMGLLLGSVSHQVTAHAPCPVAVVPQDLPTADAGDSHRRIVVGVDGSEDSRAALQWAVDEAALRGVGVLAVVAWQLPYATAEVVSPTITEEALRGSAEAALERVAATVEIPSGTTLTSEAVEGHPARALLQASEGEDLLVVGSRGYGGFVGLLLGSVSHQVAAHSAVPVVVVPRPASVDT